MRITYTDSEVEFAAAGAAAVAAAMAQAVAARGAFSLVLAGGSSPAPVYAELAARPGLPWDKTFVFFGDERCVGPEHEYSNYRMARASLLDPAGIPETNVLRMRGELDVRAGTEDYAARIHAFFGSKQGEWPRFDLVLLGMGSDGHTASLFPGRPEVNVSDALVVAVPESPTPPNVPRITLSVPLLTAARQVLFLVAGADKLPLVSEITENPAQAAERYPAALVAARSDAEWLVRKG